MTQDCSIALSTADENKCNDGMCFPEGIHITELDSPSGSGIEGVSKGEEDMGDVGQRQKVAKASGRPWGYLSMHNRRVEAFKEQVDAYNRSHADASHDCFIHYSCQYKQKKNGKGVVKRQVPSISGLVFLQGETSELQAFLQANYPFLHLVNNCSTGRPASIPDRVMRPFMAVMSSHPERITFLRDPFVKFAKDHVRLRVLTGIFAGQEGYVVRVNRDRQLVMDLGGYAVAISNVHNEDFEVVEL